MCFVFGAADTTQATAFITSVTGAVFSYGRTLCLPVRHILSSLMIISITLKPRLHIMFAVFAHIRLLHCGAATTRLRICIWRGLICRNISRGQKSSFMKFWRVKFAKSTLLLLTHPALLSESLITSAFMPIMWVTPICGAYGTA